MMKRTNVFLLFLAPLFLLALEGNAKTVSYDFDIDYINVNHTGETVQAMGVGGSIPAPTIEATVGDTLRVTFHNKMDVESSIHWHGVLLPNDQDGVPYLTTQPVKAGGSLTFEYPVIHSGTYWYHSHTGLQEQRGVYGSIVFHPKEGERIQTDRDYVVVFSDWSNEKPSDIIANLKKDGDYYALKKGSVQSWDKVLSHGKDAVKSRLQAAYTRMGPMDLSDVGYDAFLANGKQKSFLKANPGETVRLRIINAAASTYFDVAFADAPMKLVSADGVDVSPIEVKRLKIAIAETYDVIVKIPENKAYELRATAEDGTGHASLFVGKKGAPELMAPDIPRPNLFTVDHSAHGKMNHDMGDMNMDGMDHSMHAMMGHDMGGMDMKMNPSSVIDHMTDYSALKSPTKTTLEQGRKERVIPLTLTGNMERYVWTFDNTALSESDKILIKRGENVKMIFKNETMMHHPLHLHGHFFRVLNGQGDYSPLKHTVNVPPMSTVEIEFAADEEKDWFFHCHNLYHMKSGMARVLSYGDSKEFNPALLKKIAPDTHWYFAGDISAMSHMTKGSLRTSNSKNALEAEFEYGYDKEGYDVDALYERTLTRFLDVYVGGEFTREDKDEPVENKAVAGFHYVLPMLIESDLRLDGEGDLELMLESDLQLTDRTKFEWEWTYDFEAKKPEYAFQISYEVNKSLHLTAGHDAHFNTGVGLRFKF